MKAKDIKPGDTIEGWGEVLATRYDSDKKRIVLTFKGFEVELIPDSDIQMR